MDIEDVILREMSHRKTNITCMWNLKNKKQKTHRYGEPIGGFQRWVVDEMGKDQKVQTSCYKRNTSWRCDVQHGDYSLQYYGVY